ncbi:3-hydroxyacyl-[acyl-carrier-protein] dehydratase [Marchantia polymorpha subsp. ruderalis]|uniref:3-hydroxyacyl-[acyl-carrier-protein] dehydratase n=2 Tax=Marchantia polymorpha TaxID=3197 RepID=A0AAF6AXI6_MARPO|nr:hypothetical protein MARPO_0022s0038 [Marchantia polymorpha]BBN04470.1 hypothetical protein Mp_3g04910 [Marchantia polymorpha subsp. ruderalis]|eukprot:PTQ43932.1 hypothetical protein MARPO_0022s0038 [Marchantia polymorpha]
MEALAASSFAECRLVSGVPAISGSTSSSNVVSSLAFSRNAVVAGKARGLFVTRSLASRQPKRLPVSCCAADGNAVATESATAESAADEVPIEKRYPAFPSVLDINAIRNILPHRFPFLLVDRVIEYNPGVSAVAIKNVTINDNFFPGHFPDRPIMPGVLMVEAMAQVGGIVMLQPDVGGSKETFFFAGVDKVRFRKPVIAGDTLVMRMNLIKLQKRFGIAKMEGKAYVGGVVVCEGEFLMALGSEE